MTRRGFTLVELMISVAVMGVMGLLFDVTSNIVERRASEELQRARAEVLVSELVRASAMGRPVDPATRAKLEAGLPRVEVEQKPAAGAVTWVVRWRGWSGAPLEVSLTGLRKAGTR